MELAELPNFISFYMRKWTTAKDARKAETVAPPAENIANAKRIAANPLQS